MASPLPETPSFRLEGRRALVGRGLGLAAAAGLAHAGAEVTLAARTRGEVEAAAEALRAGGGLAVAMIMDVGDVAAAGALIDAHGPFDILVNNAGQPAQTAGGRHRGRLRRDRRAQR